MQINDGSTAIAKEQHHPRRLWEVDVGRGLTVAAMIVFNLQFKDESTFAQLRHPPFLGLTAADFVFPNFLFLSGMSIPLALRHHASTYRRWKRAAALSEASREEPPPEPLSSRPSHLVPKFLKRSASHFALGLVLFNTSYSSDIHRTLAEWRFMGVLQRHAIVGLVCAAWYLAPGGPYEDNWDDRNDESSQTPPPPPSMRLVHAMQSLFRSLRRPVTYMLLWTFLTYRFPHSTLPEPSPSLLLDPNRLKEPSETAAYLIDTIVLGRLHTYRGAGLDPEGLLSTLPAFFSCWLGVLYGESIGARTTRDKEPTLHTLLRRLEPPTALLAASLILNRGLGIPFSKPLWTPPFAFVTGAASWTLFEGLSVLGDAYGLRNTNPPILSSLARQPLTAYVFSSVCPKLLSLVPLGNGSVLDSIKALFNVFPPGWDGVAWGCAWTVVTAAVVGLA